ncbi:DUF1934 domain-containing protein [uncultured Megasphaera sp.]|uniref:DUF1934 domain-containing protein n=1 Tax=uncultured Megasphaera sp. TaxID=165188 RepID=UPI0025939D7F|nr:DUF1934 domain-containing protein [uncultured Megasphaera sp.]
MLKPVVVKIHSIQQDEIGKKTEFELVSTGTAHVQGDTQYIRYDERMMSEMDGVNTLVKVFPDQSVSLVRTGKIHQHHDFRKGQEEDSIYALEDGDFQLHTKVYECQVDMQDGIGTIHLEYNLSLEGMFYNYTKLTITVQEDRA